MAAIKNFNSIVHQIQASNLNYQLYLTPFAANISLKKSPIKDKSGRPFPQAFPGVGRTHDVEDPVVENVKKENRLPDVKLEFTKHDEHPHQELADCKAAMNKLNEENEKLKTSIENKDCEIIDLERSNKVKNEVADQLKKNLKEVKEKFHKERTELIKNHKKEVKYWRTQLGEETKMKIKLKEKLEGPKDTTKNMLTKTKLKKQSVNKNSENNPAIEENPNNSLCSLCAIEIQNYIPEYFCGEKFNPACEECKDKDTLWSPDNPFASFPTPSQPSSLVSHWTLHLPSKPPQNPSSIPSLVTHCAKLPNPGDRFISVEEALKMMMERLNSVFR